MYGLPTARKDMHVEDIVSAFCTIIDNSNGVWNINSYRSELYIYTACKARRGFYWDKEIKGRSTIKVKQQSRKT